ncbi:MAG: S8 family serine peptidase, partial [Bacteroidota bacterium]
GNEGSTPLHIYHAFNNDTIRTAVDFENRNPVYNGGRIEHWGSANSDFSVALSILDATLHVINTTPFYKASENPNGRQQLLIGDDTLYYMVTGVGSSALNQKPNLLILVNAVKKNYIVVLNVTSPNSQVDIWNDGFGTGASFIGAPQLGYIAGDTKCTVGEIGGTSKKIITVGAYTTKYTFQNIKGQTMNSTDSLDRIAYFSSRGPTADGRTKPEITAPGEQLVSSVNSFDPAYDENNDQVVMKIVQGSSKWYFGAMQGTSMATPLTAGVIALMLQANPNLGPEQVRNILQESARTDTYTGTIDPNGSNTWGWGKIDAQKAVLAASGTSGIALLGNTEFLVYPNPAKGTLFMKNNGSESLSALISVRNSIGATVKEAYNQWNAGGIYQLDLSGFPAGMYVITLTGSNNLKASFKVQFLR